MQGYKVSVTHHGQEMFIGRLVRSDAEKYQRMTGRNVYRQYKYVMVAEPTAHVFDSSTEISVALKRLHKTNKQLHEVELSSD
ncbi:hypothetical protein D3C75_135700 [compost metagenome]